MTTRVLIVDDHALMRHGLRLILSQIEPGAEIVEAADGAQALAAAREQAPNLCLVDISMPGMNGIDLLPQLHAAAPRARLLVLSMHNNREFLAQALKQGAHGYVLKDSAVDELADAIKALRQGRPYFSRAIGDTMLLQLLHDKAGAEPGGAPATLISPRQRQVLQLIAEGVSTQGMAERLFLSPKTVETHRAELMRRLGIRDVAGLTRYAIREGLVSPDV
jgi:DNA-binding NarL/FixJ family response regulator